MWSFAIKALTAVALLATVATAGIPDWMRAAANGPQSDYPADTDAVVLLSEQITSFTSSGEMRTIYRKVHKILRPKGRKLGSVAVPFDSETQITFLKGWSITATGVEYEVKEKDAFDVRSFSESFYSDDRVKLLHIPAAGPGSVIGYEFQQRGRASLLQTMWFFQGKLPVRRARFELELPANWTFAANWRNHAPVEGRKIGTNQWAWEISDLAPVTEEPKMPGWRTVAGQLGLVVGVPQSAGREVRESWNNIGRWYADLASSKSVISPEIQQKTRDLLKDTNEPVEKLRRLARYVQRNIRYVAIEVGVGAYQPHAAPEIFAAGYGDCKDKATLLMVMLREAGFDSYYALVHTERNYVTPEFPSALVFNHVILAIKSPESTKALAAVVNHEAFGPLLFFDPTDTETPFGLLPPHLQKSYGLIATKGGGALVQLGVHSANINRIVRRAKLSVDENGTLSGTIDEERRGTSALALANRIRSLPKIRKQTVFQELLSQLLDGAILKSASFAVDEDDMGLLTVEMGFVFPGFAQRVGDLMLIRGCPLGSRRWDVLDGKTRTQPIMLANTQMEEYFVELALPKGFKVDELPPPVEHKTAFARFRSEVRHAESHLQCESAFEFDELEIPVAILPQFKELMSKIAEDEAAYAVLKKQSTIVGTNTPSQ